MRGELPDPEGGPDAEGVGEGEGLGAGGGGDGDGRGAGRGPVVGGIDPIDELPPHWSAWAKRTQGHATQQTERGDC